MGLNPLLMCVAAFFLNIFPLALHITNGIDACLTGFKGLLH
ncbi:hypothetical protein [Methylomusa anaerophila]|nr:hypothetical protein [Methylomusa anaerophila]